MLAHPNSMSEVYWARRLLLAKIRRSEYFDYNSSYELIKTIRLMLSMLACNQICMSRAALGWSISTLSERSAVSVSTIKRLETDEGFSKATEANLRLIRETLEAAGIEFIGDADEGPGVRLWAAPK